MRGRALIAGPAAIAKGDASMLTVTITRACYIAGSVHKPGETLSVTDGVARDLVYSGKAVPVGPAGADAPGRKGPRSRKDAEDT